MEFPNWHQLRYHPEQYRLLLSKKRFKAVVAGRGSGKTEIARRKIVMSLFEKKPWPNPMYFYVLPTADQGRRVAWKPILDLLPPEFIKAKHENRMELKTIYGSELHICSGDKPHRLEGVQWDGGVIDESSDEREGIFDLNLGPAMTHRNAWCWRIGVPKRRGIGAAEFKAFWDRGIEGDPDIDSFHWMSKDILNEQDLEMRKRTMSPQDFREQYEASWEISTGMAFPDFDETLHVTDTAKYQPGLSIIVGSDFNVDPMSWVLCHFIDGKIYVFDEIFLRGTNTRKTMDHLYQLYGNHKSGWLFMGDATSRARKTSANSSDYIIINNDDRFKPREMLYPKINPAVADRLACTNGALLNALGDIRLQISPKCTNLIKDFKFRHYKEGTSELNDEGDLGHITDAMGYVVWNLIPIEVDRRHNSKIIIRH